MKKVANSDKELDQAHKCNLWPAQYITIFEMTISLWSLKWHSSKKEPELLGEIAASRLGVGHTNRGTQDTLLFQKTGKLSKPNRTVSKGYGGQRCESPRNECS